MPKLLLNEREASREFGMPVKALQYWRHRGHPDGPPFVRIGRRVYYRRSDLELWVDEAPTFHSAAEARMVLVHPRRIPARPDV